MSESALIPVALEVISLAVRAAEAAQAGNPIEARMLLKSARGRVERANDAWDAAAQPGDDEG